MKQVFTPYAIDPPAACVPLEGQYAGKRRGTDSFGRPLRPERWERMPESRNLTSGLRCPFLTAGKHLAQKVGGGGTLLWGLSTLPLFRGIHSIPGVPCRDEGVPTLPMPPGCTTSFLPLRAASLSASKYDPFALAVSCLLWQCLLRDTSILLATLTISPFFFLLLFLTT